MRAVLLGLAGLVISVWMALSVHSQAEADWRPWRSGPDFGSREPARKDRATERPPTLQSVLASRETLQAMSQAIERYQRLASGGGWQPIPSGPRLKFGVRDDRVRHLRRRLEATGDLQPGRGDQSGFDHDVEAAVQRFQERHGLTPSGDVNQLTLRALNQSPQQLLHRLRLNRQRLEALVSSVSGRRYILVNIPAYELQAVSGGGLDLSSVVVVGKPATPTPELKAAVKAVDFLPYWHVPQSIAQRALIPAVKKDPDYLERERIRAFASWGGEEVDTSQVNWWSPQGERLVFRQDPGPFNALGLIRIDIPNRHIVYMHDTPLKKLFSYYLRPYSAGCVRVDRVQDLTLWLLSGEGGWSAARLADSLQSGRQQTVTLSQPVPVHFAYISAWATAGGEAHFRIDVYDKDGEGRQTVRLDDNSADTRRVAP